jgi:hypothetical protein
MPLAQPEILKFFFKFLPDSWNCKEISRFSPLQSLNNAALESIWPSKVYLISHFSLAKDIKDKSSNVRKRKIRHYSFFFCEWLIRIGNSLEGTLNSPDKVIMT